eukprot:CCRYP_015947-RE/>CCRYP_015947-RE protein AED:0.35 eAED:0.35 QI:0/-1/0/1/-1/0/1/0/165
MKETGAWLAVIPDRFSGTALSLQEWHDNLSLRYGKTPKGLPRKCDGCGAGFTVEHGLSCKKGGLVSIRHDDVRDEWAHLCGLALTSSRVTTEPLIHYGDGMGASLGGTTGIGMATLLAKKHEVMSVLMGSGRKADQPSLTSESPTRTPSHMGTLHLTSSLSGLHN